MKKIAITQRLIKNDSYHEIREALDVNYSKLIRACGYLPIVLPYKIYFKDYMKELDIHGVILTGGNDLNSVNNNSLSETRDNFEYILKKIIQFLVSVEECRLLQNTLGVRLNKLMTKLESGMN